MYVTSKKNYLKSSSINSRCELVVRTSQFTRTLDIDIEVAGNCTNHKEARKLLGQIEQAKKPRAWCKRSPGDDNEARGEIRTSSYAPRFRCRVDIKTRGPAERGGPSDSWK